MSGSGPPLVPSSVGQLRFDAARALWLWGMLLPGVVVGIGSATLASVCVSLALAFVTLCVGHSVGLHRGVIHRTYEAGPILRGPSRTCSCWVSSARSARRVSRTRPDLPQHAEAVVSASSPSPP